MVPLLVEEEKDRMIGWQLGVTLQLFWGIGEQRRPLGWGIHWVNGDEVTQILSSRSG